MSQSSKLKQNAISGIGWSMGGSIASYGITFIVGIILARLLSPEEYGLIGIITIFITVFNGIIDSGFSNALIRKQNVTQIDCNTAFFTNLGVSLFLFSFLYLAAEPIASFFHNERLVLLTRIMGLCLIINAFSIIQIALLTKELDFKTQTKCSCISALLSGILGIALAFWGYGVWALAWQQITQKAINTICLWLFRDWRPNFYISKNSFKELFSFGWKLMVAGILNNIWGQLYQIVIGKCYTARVLGYYTKANEYVNLVTINLTSVIQKVSYPTLSRIQGDKERLKYGYRIIIRMAALVVFSCCMWMAACSKQLILVFIGEQWLPCVLMMQIVCFNLALFPIHAINLNMLQVQGRSDLFLKIEIVKKIAGILPIVIGIFFNIIWMLITGVVIGFCVEFVLNSHYSGKMLGYSSFQQVKDIAPAIFISLTMATLVFIVGLIQINPYILLPLQCIIGFLVTIFLCEYFKLQEYIEIKNICGSILKIR